MLIFKESAFFMHTVLRALGPTTRNLIRVAGKLQWPPGDKAPSSKRFLPPPRPPSARLCGHPSLSQICLTVRQEVSPVAARLSPPVIPGTARTYGFQVGARKWKNDKAWRQSGSETMFGASKKDRRWHRGGVAPRCGQMGPV